MNTSLLKGTMFIRNETPDDYRAVEKLTRKAFWNLHAPGCNEHFLVHKLRAHEDFIPELDLVLVDDDKIIGHIAYTRAKLINEADKIIDIVTFGPVSIDPEYQRRGLGRQIIEHSCNKAKGMGFNFVVIFGNPNNYVSMGFKSCVRYNIHMGGIYPTAMLVKRIGDNTLGGGKWRYVESAAYQVDANEALEFDQGFEPWERTENDRQEEFFILSNSTINNPTSNETDSGNG